MTAAGTFVVDAAHPSLPGHFPGDPVVPGMLVLDAVLALAVPAGCEVAAVPLAKFVRPVSPGETVAVSASAAGADRVAFVARNGAGVVMQGSAELRRVSRSPSARPAADPR
jgi:3-hydroxymyristoyl/3-hydroxydecanoyl-(acyl carrier protein) dehydratase